MKRIQQENTLKLTIAEPFPVVPQEGERCGQAKGPFFAPGSVWYYPKRTIEHVERMATYLRGLGYTVTVTI